MHYNFRKILCFLLSAVIVLSFLSACAGQQPAAAESEDNTQPESETVQETPMIQETEPIAQMASEPLSAAGEDELQSLISKAILEEKQDSIEVLVVGGGETFCSVIPMNLWRDYGYTAYVFGSDLHMISLEDPALIQILDYHHPNVLVMETAAFYRAFDEPDPLAEKTAVDSMIFRRNVSCTFRAPSKGYVIKSETKPAEHREVKEEPFSAIPESNELRLRSLAEECSSRGIAVVFYTAPNLVTWNSDRHDVVQKLADELGIPYLDENLVDGAVDWNADSWNEGAHLNYDGAKKATEKLGDFLCGTGIPEDRRSQQEYSYWNDYLTEFEEMARKFTEY